jgi:hypothetical protein
MKRLLLLAVLFSLGCDCSEPTPASPEISPEYTEAPYGYCPQCGAPGKSRERRLGGNDECANGHTYPSADAIRLQSMDSKKGENTPEIPDGYPDERPNQPLE